MKTESFILRSPEKFHRDGLISVINYTDKENDSIHIQYCDENYNVIDEAFYSYKDYMNEMFKSNGIKGSV